MKIRSATPADAEIIHQLSWQLGYSPELKTVHANIVKMLSLADFELVVAENDLNEVIGWMSLSVRHRIEDIPFLQVAALVTDESVRGDGCGKLLMNYAEETARRKGLAFVGLHSSKRRVEAHGFYEHIGYTKLKESFFFKKDLP